jgi:uncharacterized protein YraI
MTKILAGMLVALALGAMAPAAQAQAAYAAKDVNLRAGPGRDYPVVAIVPSGAALAVQGCLSDYAWCDVIAGPERGWVYAGNIDYAYGDAYVPLASYGPALGIAIVGFVLFDYWNRFYVHQPFYRDRERWEHHAPPRPRAPAPRREGPVLPAAPQLRPSPPPALSPVPRGQRPPHVTPPIRQQGPASRQPPAPTRPYAPQRPPAPALQPAPVRPAPPARVSPPAQHTAPHIAPQRDGARAPQTPGREGRGPGTHRPGPPDRGELSR